MPGLTVPRWAWFAIGGLLLLLAFYLAISAYGNSRYREGVRDTDAKWEEASSRLKAEAAKSATRADDAAARRLEEYVQQSSEDAAAVEKAKAEGRSSFDELFR